MTTAHEDDLHAISSETAGPIGRATTRSRPRLLFLCQTLPFPPDGGVNIRSYNILRLLSRTFDVTALCFFRKNERPTPQLVAESLAALGRFANVEAFAIPQEHSRARWVADHIRSLLRRRAYTRYAYASRAFERSLRTLLATQRFDLVHVDSLDLSGYLPLLRGLPIACTHHNVESMLLRRMGERESSGLVARYMRHQADWTEAEELAWCDKVAVNLAVSTEDAAIFRQLVPSARVVVVPNGVDTARFQPGQESGGGIVFVGGYNWFPNRDAMRFFAETILPQIRAAGVQASVTWVGRAPARVQEAFAPQGISLTGYVDDVRPYVQSAACYVVPLRAGGGTRLKILDAWAMGKAVVSTGVGCEGLAAVDGENILIRDDPAEFAAAVRAVLSDAELRARLGRGARATAVQQYDWEVIGRELTREYLSLLPTPRA